jgi:predicted small metal-binding protein
LIQIDREAEDEIMRKARKHAAEEHNMKARRHYSRDAAKKLEDLFRTN